MKKYFFTVVAMVGMLFTVNAREQTLNVPADTAAMIKCTDSLAAVMLKAYDENSQRQTGLPRMVEHFSKNFQYNEDKKLFVVNYAFSLQKFYGTGYNGEVVELSTGFPDRFSIVYDMKTKKVRYMPEG